MIWSAFNREKKTHHYPYIRLETTVQQTDTHTRRIVKLLSLFLRREKRKLNIIQNWLWNVLRNTLDNKSIYQVFIYIFHWMAITKGKYILYSTNYHNNRRLKYCRMLCKPLYVVTQYTRINIFFAWVILLTYSEI